MSHCRGQIAGWLFNAIILGCGLIGVLADSSLADPEYIYAFHDPGGEGNMGSNKGWIVWTVETGLSGSGGGNFSGWSNQGYGVIVRLNHGYGSAGTIPYDTQYSQWASRVANYIQNSSGVDYWIIGNETNLPREWPGNVGGNPSTGQPITVSRYVSCYNQVYNAVKAVAPNAKLCPSPSGTWSPPWPSQGIEGFLDYWVNILNGIGASKIDGLVLHTYTHGCDPNLIFSEQKMGSPYQDIYYHFRAYKNYMWAIPSSMNTKPVFITETDQNVECAYGSNPQHTWVNSNSGWVKNAYAEINSWNQSNSQKIRCLALFRWPVVTEGQYTFGIADKSGVIQDFQQAVAFGYKWGSSPPSGQCAGLGSGNPSGSNLSLTAAYYIESGRNNSNQYGRYALDGVSSTKWCCNTSDSGGTASLALDLGSTCTVTGYIVRHAEYGGEADYMNTERYRIESASSIFGPWSVEYDVDNTCQDPYNRFIYSTPKNLRYVRIVVTDPGIDSWVRLPEFSVYGTAGTRDTITVYAADYQGGVNAASGTDYSDTTTGNSGGQYRSHDVDIENSTDGRNNVGWIAAGEWLNYPIQGQGNGQYTLYVRYATPNSGTQCSFKLNGASLTSALNLNNTGGWQTWQTLNAGTVNIGTGFKTIQLYCNTANFNINRFWLVPSSGGSKITVTENFTSVPSWSSSFDANWGNAASWSATSGGQSGNCLQATRSGTGSSTKVKVYSISPNESYTISIYMRCPSSSASYWRECHFKLGNYSAQDYDQNGGTWTEIKKFSDTGTNGNGDTWVQYSKNFNSGSNTQISVGFKSGNSSGTAPTIKWDTLSIQ